MILIELKKGGKTISMLVPLDFQVSLITANVDELFALDELIKEATANIFIDYSYEIKKLAEKLSLIKSSGAIGYPLDARDPELYALDKKITITDRMDLICD